MRRWLPLIPVAVTLAFGACGGGGCGGPDNAPAGPQDSDGQASGKPAPHGGQVDFSEFDSKKWDQQHPDGMQYTAGPSGLKPRERRRLAPPRVDWLDPVTPDSWEATVSSGSVLVMAAQEGCADCALAGSALKMLEPRVPEHRLRRYDVSAPETPSLLPKGFPRKPLPDFLLYENGKLSSSLAGLPFPRAPGEPDKDYRVRLYRWFRDALTERDLRFGRR